MRNMEICIIGVLSTIISLCCQVLPLLRGEDRGGQGERGARGAGVHQVQDHPAPRTSHPHQGSQCITSVNSFLFNKGENLTLTCGSVVDSNLAKDQKVIWRLNRKPLLLPEPILVIVALFIISSHQDVFRRLEQTVP